MHYFVPCKFAVAATSVSAESAVFIFVNEVFRLASGQGGIFMRICRWATAFASISLPIILFASVAGASDRRDQEIDLFASMAGKCSALKVAERNFACNSIAFFHTPGGRSSFAVPLNDPEDESHIITFSGEKSKLERDNLYELAIDRMLVKSRDRPKVDGLPVPSVELSTGTCRQVGNLAAQRVSSVSCSATDESGKKYEMQFESDGSPIKVQMIMVAESAEEDRKVERVATHVSQLKCRQMAEVQGILPRYRTAFILKCMEE